MAMQIPSGPPANKCSRRANGKGPFLLAFLQGAERMRKSLAECADPGNFNRSLTTFAYRDRRRELGRAYGEERQRAQAEADGENAEATGEGEAAPKKGLKRFLTKKILMIAVRPGSGAGRRRCRCVLLSAEAEGCRARKVAEAPLTPPEVAFSDVPDILVNIQSSDGTPAYLKLSLSLEMDNELEKTGMTALMPRLVDQFQSYLRELRVEDLKGFGRRAQAEGRAAAPGQCLRCASKCATFS